VAASSFQAFQIPTLLYELGINVLINARQAKDVPAVVHIEEDVSVKILVIFSLTLSAVYYLCSIGSEVSLYFRFFYHG
jgi:hypothetical protein